MNTKVSKALTFRASSLGDCLMGKYLLENIHAQYPDARLGIVVGSRGAMIRDLFAAYPWLEIIEANRRSPKSLISLWKNFRESDMVITQYAGRPGGRFSLASKLAARILAKKGGLIGFADASPWNGFLYDRLVSMDQSSAVVERDRAALRAAGIPISLPFPTMQCIENDAILSRLALERGTYVVAHLFAGNTARGLHTDKKRELLAELAKKLPYTRLVVTGGAGDKDGAMRAAQGTGAAVIAGEATLQETMNLIKQSRGVVSVDTGIAHIAAQLHKPLVVLRTCIGRNWWLPGQYEGNAPIAVFSCDSVCEHGHVGKEYPACMNAINMEEVARKVSVV